MKNKKMYISGDFVKLIKQGKLPKIVFAGKRCVYYEKYDVHYDEYYYKTLCGHYVDNIYGDYCPLCGLKIVVDE